MNAYLERNMQEVAAIQDPQRKKEMQALLAQHGWVEPVAELPDINHSSFSILAKISSPRKVRDRLRHELFRLSVLLSVLLSGAPTKSAWIFLRRHFGVHPPAENKFVFGTAREAIDYAQRFPRRKTTCPQHLETIRNLSDGSISS
jgi:hypothetical protein